MRKTIRIPAVAALIAALLSATASQPALSSFSLMLEFRPAQVAFETPVLPPIGHSRFCLRYPDDCRVHGIDFRHRNIALTPERWTELNAINREVNRMIVPEFTLGSAATDEWLISPQAGNCKDYAVTKRHELLTRGWPSRALLLSEVIVPTGEHHLVLVVRMQNIDLVLDNLNANIRSVAMTYRQYQWVRIETPENPKFWATVSAVHATRTASASD